MEQLNAEQLNAENTALKQNIELLKSKAKSALEKLRSANVELESKLQAESASLAALKTKAKDFAQQMNSKLAHEKRRADAAETAARTTPTSGTTAPPDGDAPDAAESASQLAALKAKAKEFAQQMNSKLANEKARADGAEASIAKLKTKAREFTDRIKAELTREREEHQQARDALLAAQQAQGSGKGDGDDSSVVAKQLQEERTQCAALKAEVLQREEQLHELRRQHEDSLSSASRAGELAVATAVVAAVKAKESEHEAKMEESLKRVSELEAELKGRSESGAALSQRLAQLEGALGQAQEAQEWVQAEHKQALTAASEAQAGAVSSAVNAAVKTKESEHEAVLSALDAKFQHAEADRSKLIEHANAIECRLEESTKRLSELEEDLEGAHESVSIKEQRVDELEADLSAMQAALQQAQAEHAQQLAQAQEVQGCERAVAVETAIKAKEAEHNAVVSALSEKLRGATEQCEKLDKLAKSAASIASAQSEEMTSALETKEAEIAKLASELSFTKAKHNEYEASASTRAARELESRLAEQAAVHNAALKSKVLAHNDEASSAMEAKQAEIAELESKLSHAASQYQKLGEQAK
eukprot:g4426.t1